MQEIIPCLWFDSKAEQAAAFYCSVFPNSKIISNEKYLTETPSKKAIGSTMTVLFELNGNKFLGLNGGPYFKFNEAVSFMIPCKDQKEIDYYYEKLSADPKSEMCGWLKDKFGVSWQLVTDEIDKLGRKKEVMEALLKMKRLNINKLKEIYERK